MTGHADIAQEILEQINSDVDRFNNLNLDTLRGHAGMRDHAEQLRSRLPDELGTDTATAALAAGGAATTREIVDLAADAMETIRWIRR